MSNDSGSDDDNAIEKPFTKGPWSQEEDDLLIAYVEEHGAKNWNAVRKNSTLSRSGKSCRFRWVNYLRPDLKKGDFTAEEEQRVVELHAVMGSKWSRMAAQLPGRTDNEIKNFWNTRLKRLKRQGLPIYPDEVREKAMNAATQSCQNTDSLDAHSSQDSLEIGFDEMPTVDFKFLPTIPSPSYIQALLYPVGNPMTDSFLRQRPRVFQPNMYNSIASPSLPFTRTRFMNEQSLPVENYPFVERSSSFLRQGPCAFQPNLYNSIASTSGTALPFTGRVSMNEQSLPVENYPFAENTLEHVHLLDNATYYSPSEPLIHRTGNFEELPLLRSFDSRTLEAQQSDPISDNTLVQPPLTDQTPSIDYRLSLYDGLLESVVYGSSGARQATETGQESPRDIYSFLGPTDPPPPWTSNTTGQNFNLGSTSSDQIPLDGDGMRHLFGKDRNNTK